MGGCGVTGRQRPEDTAVLQGTSPVAGRNEQLKLFSQCLQGGDARLDHRDFARCTLPDGGTVGGFFLAKSEQLSDLLQGEAEPLGPLQEEHALDVGLWVAAIAASWSPGLLQKPLSLVKANGFDTNPAPSCKLADGQTRALLHPAQVVGPVPMYGVKEIEWWEDPSHQRLKI